MIDIEHNIKFEIVPLETIFILNKYNSQNKFIICSIIKNDKDFAELDSFLKCCNASNYDIDIYIHFINVTEQQKEEVELLSGQLKNINFIFSFQEMDKINQLNDIHFKFKYCEALLKNFLQDIIFININSLIRKDIKLFYNYVKNHELALKINLLENSVGYQHDLLFLRNNDNNKNFLREIINIDNINNLDISQSIKNNNIDIVDIAEKFYDRSYDKNNVIWFNNENAEKYNYYQSLKSLYSDTKNNIDKINNKFINSKKQYNIKILLPRIDLNFKDHNVSQIDTKFKEHKLFHFNKVKKLKKYWILFALERKNFLEQYGHKVEIITLPFWDITTEYINKIKADYIFIPHRNNFQLGELNKTALFYMQVIFPWLFSYDTKGWSALNSKYPVDYKKGSWLSLAFSKYKYKLLYNNVSKFSQPQKRSKKWLLNNGEIPKGDFIFFPLQLPHDQAIEYNSDIELYDLFKALVDFCLKNDINIVVKIHPANPRKQREIVEEFKKGNIKNIYWTRQSIHSIIPHAKAIYTINSGVGFEALFYYKPVVTFGRIEYDAVAIKGNINSLDKAWQEVNESSFISRLINYRKFIDYYCNSFCVDLQKFESNIFGRDFDYIEGDQLYKNDDIEKGELEILPKRSFWEKIKIKGKDKMLKDKMIKSLFKNIEDHMEQINNVNNQLNRLANINKNLENDFAFIKNIIYKNNPQYLRSGERQVGNNLEDISADHKVRYQFVLNYIQDRHKILDLACGVGYGSYIMAKKSNANNILINAVDISEEAIEFAKQYYQLDNIEFIQSNCFEYNFKENQYDLVISFETIEYVEDDKKLAEILYNTTKAGGKLICSVPNEAIMPFDPNIFIHHKRHYFEADIKQLLEEVGFKITKICSQENKYSKYIEDHSEGAFLILVAEKTV